jgi:hypothetical protein
MVGLVETPTQGIMTGTRAAECDEKARLALAFHAACNKISQLSGSLQPGTPAWRDATHQARQDSEAAMTDLNVHRAEHGC